VAFSADFLIYIRLSEDSNEASAWVRAILRAKLVYWATLLPVQTVSHLFEDNDARAPAKLEVPELQGSQRSETDTRRDP
jgi:hypothetical protein